VGRSATNARGRTALAKNSGRAVAENRLVVRAGHDPSSLHPARRVLIVLNKTLFEDYEPPIIAARLIFLAEQAKRAITDPLQQYWLADHQYRENPFGLLTTGDVY